MNWLAWLSFFQVLLTIGMVAAFVGHRDRAALVLCVSSLSIGLFIVLNRVS